MTMPREDSFAGFESSSDSPIADEIIRTVRGRREFDEAVLTPPAQTRVVAVANQKGGVGKTTSAVNLAAALATKGARVLVIDLDPQGNASTALGVDHTSGTPSVYEALLEGQALRELVSASPDIDTLFCVPATIDLAGADIELVSVMRREFRLHDSLTGLLQDDGPRYDYVFIDCPPSLGLLTLNALVVADEVLIPIQCEYYALEGLTQLRSTIGMVRQHLNPRLDISSILLTMYDQRTNLAREVAAEVRAHFPAQTLQTTVPRSVRVSEAPSHATTVITHDGSSPGAVAYMHAALEFAAKSERVEEDRA